MTDQAVINEPVINQPVMNQPVMNQQPVINRPVINQPVVQQPPFPGNAYHGLRPISVDLPGLTPFPVYGDHNVQRPQLLQSIYNMMRQDQLERHAHSFPSNANQRNASSVPGAQNPMNAPQGPNGVPYLTRERFFADPWTPEQRLMAAGIAFPRRPRPAPGSEAGERQVWPPRESLTQSPLVVRGDPSGIQNSETGHIIRQSYDDSLFHYEPRNGADVYNRMMLARFLFEFTRLQSGLATGLSDPVVQWLLRMLFNEVVRRLNENQRELRPRRN